MSTATNTSAAAVSKTEHMMICMIGVVDSLVDSHRRTAKRMANLLKCGMCEARVDRRYVDGYGVSWIDYVDCNRDFVGRVPTNLG